MCSSGSTAERFLSSGYWLMRLLASASISGVIAKGGNVVLSIFEAGITECLKWSLG